MQLILASQSPRRRQLLSQVGYQFDIVVPDEASEDEIQPDESVRQYVARLAFQKAANILAKIDRESIIIACDTVADLDGKVLGKPIDRQHAEEMLRLLGGRNHFVYSGLCVWRVPGGQPDIQVAASELQMKPLSNPQIESYLDSLQWQGKSGAFGYQDGHPWLKLISGTAANVVGLPLDLLREMLKSYGV
jgi:septum formation protein